MTTIAYRDGILAGDGRETNIAEDESPVVLRDDCQKVFRLKDGRLYGGSRGSEDIERLKRSLEKKQDPPKLEDINALLIEKDGSIWLYEGNIWQAVTQDYYAIGSGSLFAFSAMDAGASAIEAVRVGIRRDPYSGGSITHVRLRKKK